MARGKSGLQMGYIRATWVHHLWESHSFECERLVWSAFCRFDRGCHTLVLSIHPLLSFARGCRLPLLLQPLFLLLLLSITALAWRVVSSPFSIGNVIGVAKSIITLLTDQQPFSNLPGGLGILFINPSYTKFPSSATTNVAMSPRPWIETSTPFIKTEAPIQALRLVVGDKGLLG